MEIRLNNKKNKEYSYIFNSVVIITIFSLFIGGLSILKAPPIIYTFCYFFSLLVIIIVFKQIYYICLYLIILLFNSFFLSSNSFYLLPISVNSFSFLLLCCCCIATFFLIKGKKDLKNNEFHIVNIPLFLWMLYTGAIILFKSNDISPIYLMVIMSYFLISMLMKNIVETNEKYAKLFLYTYFLAVVIIVAFWYIEIIRGKTFFSVLWTQADRYRMGFLRAGSTVGDNNTACLITGTALLFFQTKAFKEIIGKNIIKFLSFLIIFMLVFSFSRTAWLSLAIAIVFLIITRLRKIFLLIFPLFGAIVGYLIITFIKMMSIDLASSNTRMVMNDLSLNVLMDNFWTGIGWGNFKEYSIRVFGGDGIVDYLSNMNTYYFILVTGGIIAGVFLLFYVISMSKYSLLYIYDRNSVYKYIVAALIYWGIYTFTLDTFDILEFWIMPTIITAIYKYEFRYKNLSDS